MTLFLVRDVSLNNPFVYNISIFFLCKRIIMPFKKNFSSIMLTTRYSKSLTPFEPIFQKKFKKTLIFLYLSIMLTNRSFKS